MKPEIKQRIEQIHQSEIPEAYKKTKAGILPGDWDVYMLGDCLSRVERPVEVKPNELYTQIGIRSHGVSVPMEKASSIKNQLQAQRWEISLFFGLSRTAL